MAQTLECHEKKGGGMTGRFTILGIIQINPINLNDPKVHVEISEIGIKSKQRKLLDERNR